MSKAMTRTQALNQFRELYDRIGLDHKALAREMGSATRTIYAWHTGDRMPSMQVLKHMVLIAEKRP